MAPPHVTFHFGLDSGGRGGGRGADPGGAAVWVLGVEDAAGPGGREIARRLVAQYVNVDAALVALQADARGRLGLALEPVAQTPRARTLDFSLAHAGPVLVVGIAPAGRIGVDVELLDTPVEVASLARDYLTAAEQRWLAGLPAAEQGRAFLRCWTAKEALAKALGLGVALGMEQIETVTEPDGSLRFAALHGKADLVRGWGLVQREAAVGGASALIAVALGGLE